MRGLEDISKLCSDMHKCDNTAEAYVDTSGRCSQCSGICGEHIESCGVSLFTLHGTNRFDTLMYLAVQ